MGKREVRDLSAAARNSLLVCFDNLSELATRNEEALSQTLRHYEPNLRGRSRVRG